MLRKRLYSGLLPLLTLLVVLNIFVILQIRNLDNTFERIQLENYRSILSLRNLNVEASRMTMSSILAKNGLEVEARALARDAIKAIEDELQNLRYTSISGGGGRHASDLEAATQELVRLFSSYTTAGGESPAPADVQQLVSRLLERSSELIRHNQELLEERTHAFRQKSRLSNYIILTATGLSILFALVFSHLMSRRIVGPIERLTESTRQIANGNWEIVVDESGKDEVGELSRVLNNLVTQLREYRRLTDRRLLRSRRRMEAFLDNAPDAIFFINSRQAKTYQNPRARRLFEEMNWEAAGLPEDLAKDISQVLQEGTAILPGDLSSALIIGMDGKRYAYLPVVIPLETEEIEGREVAVVLQDVTKMRLANDLKSNLLATVSHEIKTPLTSARMSLYLVLDGEVGPLNEKQRDLLETTRGDMERLLTLLNNILDFARLEAGVSQLKLQASAPRALVLRALGEFKSTAAMNHMELAVEIDEDLPDVMVDRARIQVVFANLVSNALKHSTSGAKIGIYAHRDGEGVRFGVIDEGEGVPREAASGIFERFYRAPGGAKAGAGLGLSISREIVVAHGGSIGYENRNGMKGADFYFILPLA